LSNIKSNSQIPFEFHSNSNPIHVQICFEFLLKNGCDPVQVINMKVAPNNSIYLLEYFIFLEASDHFPDLILFLCLWEKINRIIQTFFYFLTGWARKPARQPANCNPHEAYPTRQLPRASSPIPRRSACVRAPRDPSAAFRQARPDKRALTGSSSCSPPQLQPRAASACWSSRPAHDTLGQSPARQRGKPTDPGQASSHRTHRLPPPPRQPLRLFHLKCAL
jgi:hypothetical protein